MTVLLGVEQSLVWRGGEGGSMAKVNTVWKMLQRTEEKGDKKAETERGSSVLI